jgi:hypothetical protein
MLLDNLHRAVTWNSGSGIGGMARLVGSPSTTMAVIWGTSRRMLPPPAVTPEFVAPILPLRYYANDYLNDADGDGLGGLLETELGLCDTQGACGSLGNSRDSDGDGIADPVEVFGAAFPTGPDQLLPRWGTDPRHKDIFVEVDWRGAGQVGNPFAQNGRAQAIASFAQQALEVGSAWALQNRDGHPGVNLHIDIGVPPPPGVVETRYGHWGGSNACAQQNRNDAWRDDSCMTPNRRGLFFYAYGDPNSPGQASGNVFDFGYLNGDVGTLRYNFIHELGHTLGLAHWGSDWYGGALMNNNPYYCSLMNYSMSNGSCSTRFSDGWNRTIQLNPASVVETTAPKRTWFANYPFLLSVSPGGAFGVDWDRDQYQANAALRAPVAAADRTSDQIFANENVLIRFAADRRQAPFVDGLVGSGNTEPDGRSQVTPALVHGPGARITVLYVDVDGRVRYGTSPVSSSGSGCTRGDSFLGLRNTGCSPAMPEVPTTNPYRVGNNEWTVTGIPIDPANPGPPLTSTQVDRIVFGSGANPELQATSISAAIWHNRLYVAWQTSNGSIYLSTATSFLPATQEWTSWVGPVMLFGAAGSPSRTRGQISLAVWNTNPAHGVWAQAQTLVLTYSLFFDNDGFVAFRTLPTPTSSWSSQALMLDQAGQLIPAGAGVVMAPWPDASGVSSAGTETATTCAVFLEPPVGERNELPWAFPQRMRIRCLNPLSAQRRWQEAQAATQSLNVPGEAILTHHVPGFVFRASRLANGSIAYPWNDHGVFWLIYLTPGTDGIAPRIIWSTRLTTETGKRPWETGHDWTFIRQQQPWWSNTWGRSIAGVSLVMPRSFGAMKGVWFRGSSRDPGHHGIVVEPVADGTWNGLLCDGNDYVVMRRGICAGVRHQAEGVDRPDVYCGGERWVLEGQWFGEQGRATCLPQ